MTPKRIAVVGGGISGLTAAFALAQARRQGAPLEEYLFEASPRLGGALYTERVEGCVVESGADSFLTEKRDALELCQQLGLGDQVIGSQDHQRKTLILRRGKLVPLPEGFEFLVPTRLLAVAGTPLLSWRDKLALAMEIFARPPGHKGDESVASFVERHFGRGLLENIADPLLSGIYGGDAELLSVQAVLPRMVELEQKWGSLIRGVRRAARGRRPAEANSPGQGSARAPIFSALRDGLGTLVDALQAQLEVGRVSCGRPLVGVTPTATSARSAGYRLVFEGNHAFEADALILALPAYESARLLGGLDDLLAARLSEIPYSSSLIVALGYDAAALTGLPGGFGFLVPRKERRRLIACTFVGQKFSGRVPPGLALLRCFLGGTRDEAVVELSDTEAGATVQRELRSILGIAAEPRFLRVYRWRKALAQYTVGHQERLGVIRARVAQHRGLSLCGNAYHGIGVPDCIRSGRMAAEDCLGQLRDE